MSDGGKTSPLGSSNVGSIGVITMGLGVPELIKKIGVENRTYTSGESKSINNPLDPVKESDVAIIKRNRTYTS